MHNSQCFLIPQIFERAQGWMQPKVTIQVNAGLIASIFRFWNGEPAAMMIVIRISVRDDGADAIHAAALKYDDKNITRRLHSLRSKGHARHPGWQGGCDRQTACEF